MFIRAFVDVFVKVKNVGKKSSQERVVHPDFMNIVNYTALKHSGFGPLLDIGLLVRYKGFSLIFLGDKQLLGDGYTRVFLLHTYMQFACHARLVRC